MEYCWATMSVLAVASVAAAGATRISGETASEAWQSVGRFLWLGVFNNDGRHEATTGRARASSRVSLAAS
jgi:hypothetical protein